MCVCVCIYTHICTYKDIFKNIYIYMYEEIVLFLIR